MYKTGLVRQLRHRMRAIAHRGHVGIREGRVARLGGRADHGHGQGRGAGALVADGAVDCCARPLCLVAPRARARAAVAGTAARAEEGLHHLVGFETEEAAVGFRGEESVYRVRKPSGFAFAVERWRLLRVGGRWARSGG